jgi:hypothetical protein
VSPCEFYFSFSFRPTPPCCQRRSIDRAANAAEMRRGLINFTYERKQHLRLIMKTVRAHFVCVSVFLHGWTLFAAAVEFYSG